MKHWPVPDAYSRKVPSEKDAAFGAPRSYRRGLGKHCGIDIYAPAGSKVVAIEEGKIVHVSDFTGPPSSPQWRKTYYVMVEHKDKKVVVYGEIRKPRLKKGQTVKSGQVVGHLAKVLFGKTTQKSSMLHFEFHKKGSKVATDWYNKKPNKVINPTNYLKSLL